jgi:hypothetical protein
VWFSFEKLSVKTDRPFNLTSMLNIFKSAECQPRSTQGTTADVRKPGYFRGVLAPTVQSMGSTRATVHWSREGNVLTKENTAQVRYIPVRYRLQKNTIWAYVFDS